MLVLEDVENPDNDRRGFSAGRPRWAPTLSCCHWSRRSALSKVDQNVDGGDADAPFTTAEPWPEVLDDLRRDGIEIVALTPSGSEEIVGFDERPRIALVAGHEGRGLSEARSRADRQVRIPMTPSADSLNVVTAVTIVLPHLVRGDRDRARDNPIGLVLHSTRALLLLLTTRSSYITHNLIVFF